MTDEQLQAASEALRAAGEQVSNAIASKRLHVQADQLDELAETKPEPGRVISHEDALKELKGLLGPEHVGHIDSALDELRAYRQAGAER